MFQGWCSESLLEGLMNMSQWDASLCSLLPSDHDKTSRDISEEVSRWDQSTRWIGFKRWKGERKGTGEARDRGWRVSPVDSITGSQFQEMAAVLFRCYRYFQLFGHFVTCDVDILFKTQNERLSERKRVGWVVYLSRPKKEWLLCRYLKRAGRAG